MMTMRRTLVALLCLSLTGCGGQETATPEAVSSEDATAPADTLPVDDDEAAKTASVTGTVFYLQRIALTPEAVITVKLQDVSLQDVAAVTITEQVSS